MSGMKAGNVAALAPNTSWPATTAQPGRTSAASGSRSSIQADAERHGTVQRVAAIIGEQSGDGSESEDKDETEDPQAANEDSPERDAAPGSPSQDHYTFRFKHVITDEGHAVITGRDGTMQRCEDEPIHAPGAIQAFGLMVVIQQEPDGRFLVRYVSENSKRIIGYSPQDLFRLDDFLGILSEEQAEILLDHIDFIKDEDADPSTNGPDVFALSIRPPGKPRSVKLWCALHIHPTRPDLILCEFELADDREYPLRPPDEELPDNPEDTLRLNPTTEELIESTEVLSRPLRVLRNARKKTSEAGAVQVFDIMSQVQEQLANAPSLEKLLKIAVGIIKELTGFHRVMIYQFDSSYNGKVVTELVDPAQTRDLYMGLNFPASDIPQQARNLYKLNKVRVLYDRDLETARIVCRTKEDLEPPLDMTHAYLRAISPIHLKYLENMAVRSSMSISINAFGDLWGLAACHSYGPRGMRVSFPVRKMCRLVGETVARNIERLSYTARLDARKLLNAVPGDKNPSGCIAASSDDLLKLFRADFGMLSIGEEAKVLGKVERSQEALAIVEYLRLARFKSVFATQDVAAQFPDLHYPPGFSVIAGLLYVPLSVDGEDFIVFFRKGQVMEVKWGGNPYEKTIHEGTVGYLEPRKSFKTWCETVVGKCREWSEEQVESAAVLCLVYGKFIEVWRQKQAALKSSRLTRLLLENSAHEVRTPLNAIINYLEIALEGTLDQETRDNLARSHSASQSLVCVINDLLDLTKTEKGLELVKGDIFDLSACIREATEPFESNARRKGLGYEVVEHPGFPRHVIGDQRRVRQVVTNLVANAVAYTSAGFVKVELYVVEVQGCRIRLEIVVQDTGKGMSDTQVDALFRELEQVSMEPDMEVQSFDEQAAGKERHGKTLGLGLAMVARILRNMDGQLRLKSEEGKGSRFIIQLPFDLPEEAGDPTTADKEGLSHERTTSPGAAAQVAAISPEPHEGEVTLVDSASCSAGTGSPSLRRSLGDILGATDQDGAEAAVGDGGISVDVIPGSLTISGLRPAGDAQQSHCSQPSEGEPGAGSHGPLDSVGVEPNKPPPETPEIRDLGHRKEFVKPIPIPDNKDDPQIPQHISGVEAEDKPAMKEQAASAPDGHETEPVKLQVLIAEDDPINMKLLRKRLEKAGHKVSHALNGDECATMYKENPQDSDVILMDMQVSWTISSVYATGANETVTTQMPIMDGLTSTKVIRSFEQSGGPPGLSQVLSNHKHNRIPIFAVSASLVEKDKDMYVDAGFDGWILKPINFQRLEMLLRGITDDGARNGALYVRGRWEKGGWFEPRSAEDAK
jgi:light-regulated signal transduction histidine kinase (bacteriophytochrome)/CheY-like chemotaxis protein